MVYMGTWYIVYGVYIWYMVKRTFDVLPLEALHRRDRHPRVLEHHERLFEEGSYSSLIGLCITQL